MDLNTLWEYVNNLSQLHEGIRAQTQSVLHGVQTIQARAGQESSSPIAVQVNGAINGKNSPSSASEISLCFNCRTTCPLGNTLVRRMFGNSVLIVFYCVTGPRFLWRL